MTIYFTPGPTQLHPKVSQLITKALNDEILSISHRSKRFESIVIDLNCELRKLLSIPDSHQILFLSSGTEGMERVIQNGVISHSHHLINGAFSERFYETSRELGKTATHTTVDLGSGFKISEISVPNDAELICITQNETSTGVMTPIEDVHKLKRRYPDKLLAVDIVSSAPYPNLDFSLIDYAFFSVQKCFGLPSGLGVLIISPAAVAKAEQIAKTASTGSYHSFGSLLFYSKKNQTPETPNILAIYLLACICREMNSIGITQIRAELDMRARLIYDYLSTSNRFTAFVKQANFRSPTVITVQSQIPLDRVFDNLRLHGFEVGSGYGKLKDSQFRFANFPMHTEIETKRFLEALNTI